MCLKDKEKHKHDAIQKEEYEMLNPKNIGPNEEQYEYFKHPNPRQGRVCQYDYRDETGKLFSCCRKTLAECRKAKDEWLRKR